MTGPGADGTPDRAAASHPAGGRLLQPSRTRVGDRPPAGAVERIDDPAHAWTGRDAGRRLAGAVLAPPEPQQAVADHPAHAVAGPLPGRRVVSRGPGAHRRRARGAAPPGA